MLRRFALLAALAVMSCAQGDATTAPEVTTGTLVVQNSTSTTIVVLFFSECSADVWGSDRLGGNPIGAGSNRSWTLTAGCYDIKAVGSDLRVFQKNAITVPKGSSYTLTLTNGQ